MPKKVSPSVQMEQALREGPPQGTMDLGRLMVETAALWVRQARELEREAFLRRPWGQRPTTALRPVTGSPEVRSSTSPGANP
jgi:hypothetical protein